MSGTAWECLNFGQNISAKMWRESAVFESYGLPGDRKSPFLSDTKQWARYFSRCHGPFTAANAGNISSCPQKKNNHNARNLSMTQMFFKNQRKTLVVWIFYRLLIHHFICVCGMRITCITFLVNRTLLRVFHSHFLFIVITHVIGVSLLISLCSSLRLRCHPERLV